MTLKQIKQLPNTITIKKSSVLFASKLDHPIEFNDYGHNAIQLYLNHDYNISEFSMLMINGWAYEVLDIISPTAIVIKML